MKSKGRKKVNWKLFNAIYNENTPTLEVLLKENGFTHWRDDKSLEAETLTEARDKVLAS
jgi:hypothetical protein